MNWREAYAAYINLPHRTDRDQHMQRELARVGLSAERRYGFVTKDPSWNRPPYLKLFARTPGAIGCMLSQMAVMQSAYDQGRDAIVLEDDLVFASDIKERLDYIQGFVNQQEPDTDVFFLGGTVHMNPPYWHGRPHNPDLAPYCSCTLGADHRTVLDKYIVQVFGMFSTHAYMVPYEKIPKILSLLNGVMEKSYGIDFSFIMLQPSLKCFAFLPGSVKQIDNESDIGTGVTVFSNFAALGDHWFQDRVFDKQEPFFYVKEIAVPKYRQDLVPMLKEMGLPLVVAEVGVAEGLFSKEMLDAGVEKLYLIDLWEQQKGIVGDGGSPQDWHDKNYSDLKERLIPKYWERIQFCQGYSSKMADHIPDDSLGMVYIDANHSYENVTQDIAAYLTKVVRNGVIAFHDYNEFYPGVKKAVEEFADATGRMVHLIPDIDTWHAGAWVVK